jgi:tRNA dimethylallyltransferase
LKYKVTIFGLKIERSELYRNIDKRVEEMFRKGIVQEVCRLSRMKLSQTAKMALGYNEVLGYLNGKRSLEEAKELLKRNTRHFAKRQMSWFRADKRIEWLDVVNITSSHFNNDEV